MAVVLPASPPSLIRSLQIQRRVLWALMMREVITRFGRRNLGVLWLIGEPMIFTLGVATLWSFAGLNHGASIPIVAFAITGYSSVLVWRNSVSRCSSALQQNINLLYHRNVQVIDVFLVRIALEVVGATASFVVLALFFTGIGWMQAPQDLLKVLLGWAGLVWFGGALAIFLGALTSYSAVVERLWHPAAYLLFPLSGAAFMVDWLPVPAQRVVLWLPMVHGVELLRDGYFGNTVRTHHDLGYLAVSCLLLTLAGFVAVRGASRHVEVE